MLDCILNYNVLQFVLRCVWLLCTVRGGFVLDFTYNYKKFVPSCFHKGTLLFIRSYYAKSLQCTTT